MAGCLPLCRNWHSYSRVMQARLQPTYAESVSPSQQKATLLQKYLAPSKALEPVQTKRQGCETEDVSLLCFVFSR